MSHDVQKRRIATVAAALTCLLAGLVAGGWAVRRQWQAKVSKPKTPLACPIRVDLLFVFQDKEAHDKSDCDNLEKLACDSMNKMFWKDDRQICSQHSAKMLTDNVEGTMVRLTWVEEDDGEEEGAEENQGFAAWLERVETDCVKTWAKTIEGKAV